MKKSIIGISLLTIACLYTLLSAVVIFLTVLLGGKVLAGIIISLIVLIIQFLIAPFMTDVIMRSFYKAKFDENIPDYLEKFIRNVCIKYNMEYPKIGIIHDGGPNAFTYGRTKNSTRVILTTGLFDLLNEKEVECVIAHELGHAIHHDMLFMTTAQIVPLIMYAIFEELTEGDADDIKASAVIGIIAYTLYILSEYIVLYLSRTREYYADDFAITETKHPNDLAEALVKIGYGLSIRKRNDSHDVSKNNALGIFNSKNAKVVTVSCISEKGTIDKSRIKNTMKWEKWNPWAVFYEFNSTHPLIAKRLEAISKRSHEYRKKTYIEFDLKKEVNYGMYFLMELMIYFAPIMVFLLVSVYGIIKNTFPVLQTLSIAYLMSFPFIIIKYIKRHKLKFKKYKVEDLLSEVKVSNVTTIPCILNGKIIGKGDPGCIFNEDFVIKDDTGIMLLDYNQPLFILNKIFAVFKSKKYIDADVKIVGWYRRGPIPYVEICGMTVNKKTKKIYTYMISLIVYLILFVSAVIILTI